ncbi:polysaccharide deacetylase family protein [Thalassomonas sp. M1454]|uniref:polysaccharide deacetylase family protein n=1 Tax=Thalassomonas sp. M1454 TaxID=2594477 RepID=UPI00117F7383|nr:polysaccharide deacetylase family protein [Thalassomonas sp. M1454]TRX57934.1 WalW protein [Thalassomonas sp. M1454]
MTRLTNKDDVIFILTVDTEEEWDWSDEFPNDNFSVSNIFELPAFQLFCQELGIKPTYFVDYAVANNTDAANVLANINPELCEVGAHLHPWANPPFFGETTEKSSHVVNLPIEQTQQKLDLLINKIQQNIGSTPRSFRTGRWGINGEILQLLDDKGFEVDSSIYPLYSNEFFSCESANTSPYWPNFSKPNQQGSQRKLFEIPVTCGFNRNNYSFAQKLHRAMEKPPFTWIKANGLLWHTKLLRKIYLSPELCSAKDMIKLVDLSLKKKHKVLHMYLHSSSLIEGVTGLSQDKNARESICNRIQQVIEHSKQKANIKFCTISQAKEILNK